MKYLSQHIVDENYTITYYVDNILSYECESGLSNDNDEIIIVDKIFPRILNKLPMYK